MPPIHFSIKEISNHQQHFRFPLLPKRIWRLYKPISKTSHSQLIFHYFKTGLCNAACFSIFAHGEMPERLNGTVLKTVEGDEPSGGSNPSFSALPSIALAKEGFFMPKKSG